MSLTAFSLSTIALAFFTLPAKADVNTRRVSYINLPAMEVQTLLTPASDSGCQGPDPFSNADWRNSGLTGGCPTGRIPSIVFNIGQKVSAFDHAKGAGTDVAILTLDQITDMRSVNPGATFRFELKVSGTWNRFHNNFMPISLNPSSSCVTNERFAEIRSGYQEQGLDWNSKWYYPRSKFSSGSPDYKAFQSEVNGPHGFSYIHYYDFDLNECDAPLALQLSSNNLGSLKFDMLEVNIYVCGAAAGCTAIPRLF